MTAAYFEEVDSEYLLESNLQKIRLELIKLLEDCERKECFTCNRLKCACEVERISQKSSTISNCCSSLSTMTSVSIVSSISGNNDNIDKKNTSTNKSFEEIQAWVQSCTPEKELADKNKARSLQEKSSQMTWPPNQASIWSVDAFASQQRNMQKQTTVQDFFKKFGDGQNFGIPEVFSGTLNVQAIYINDPRTQIKYKNALMQKFRNTPNSAAEYSYF